MQNYAYNVLQVCVHINSFIDFYIYCKYMVIMLCNLEYCAFPDPVQSKRYFTNQPIDMFKWENHHMFFLIHPDSTRQFSWKSEGRIPQCVRYPQEITSFVWGL